MVGTDQNQLPHFKNPSILHNHYKALAMPTEAEKFWTLRPEPVTVVNDAKETPTH
jgi:hypothetical protein